MTKTLVFITYLITSITLCFGQNHVYESDYFDFISKIKNAKANNYKSISVTIYKNHKSKRGRLFSKEIYDSNGNIQTKYEHFHHYRYYNETRFYYNNKNELIRIIEKYKSSRGYFHVTEIGYYDSGKPAFIMKDFTDRIENLEFDTIHYSYNLDGNLKYKFSNHDTIKYYYDNKGVFTYSSRNSIDTLDYRILNKYGCVIGYNVVDTTESRFTMFRDSICNVLQWSEEHYVKGKWVRIYLLENKFFGKTLIEERILKCKERELYKGSGKLSFYFHRKYKYDDKGNIVIETTLNRKGKVIETKKYLYETY